MLLRVREVVDQRRFEQFPPNLASFYKTYGNVRTHNFKEMHTTARGLAGLEHQITFLQLASFEPTIFNSQAHQKIASGLSKHLH